jgi:hypothetical protein
MTPAERDDAIQYVANQLQAELQANAPVIGKILDEEI